MRTRLLKFGSLAATALSLATASAWAQPHALVPLAVPRFSIDLASPSIAPVRHADDVLDKPGPVAVITGANLGCGRVGDDLDGLSYNRNDVVAGQTFIILFSVDRATVGSAAPDPGLVAVNRPFNVQQQAALRQAAADLFMALDGFNRAGPLVVDADMRIPILKNNTLAIGQGDMGGVDFDLTPGIAPVVFYPPPGLLDEIDDFAYPPPAPFAVRGPGPPPLFFSLKKNSPSLFFLPGTNSGADVYIDTNTTIPGTENLYAAPAALGLVANDDIDALVVFDDGNNHLNPNIDQILFSLAPGSPSLGGGVFSPADVFTSPGNGTKAIFARAADLGLAPNDNVDGLEILATNNVQQSIQNHAAIKIVPGDYDNDLVLTPADCGAFPECYSGSGLSYDFDGTTIWNISAGPGDNFNPPFVTVEPGDTVRWTWAGGTHSVVSGSGGVPDGIFSSGAPTGVLGTTFQVTFNEAFLNLHPIGNWAYGYFCGAAGHAANGMVNVQPDPCATFDMDYDGDVDCADWQAFRRLYSQLNGNAAHCPLLTPEQFAAALLGVPQQPVDVCLADMNGDGQVDGRDVQEYSNEAQNP